MSSENFVTQKKGKGKKSQKSTPTIQNDDVGMQSQFEVLEHALEPIVMPTKPKKISPLIRNAINSQPEELKFRTDETKSENTVMFDHSEDLEDQLSAFNSDEAIYSESTDDDLQENVVSDVDVVSDVQKTTECFGCYYCNWTGVNTDSDGCKRHYYGDVN